MNEDAEYYYEQGMEYFNNGDYSKAIECFLELKTIQEKTIGEEHADYAGTLDDLGFLYQKIGDYTCAKKYFFESKAVWKKIPNKDQHSDYAILLNNMGVFYDETGDYIRAEEYFFISMTAWKKLPDKEQHLYYAALLNNLGALYYKKGDYARAKKYFFESKDIDEELDIKHPYYATTLNCLGTIYHDIGDYARAKKYYFLSKTIRRRVLGIEHPDYASSLNNLGKLYEDMRDFIRAQKCYLHSKNIRKRVLGIMHPLYAQSLNNLGGLYQEMGYYARAEECYLESKGIKKKRLGKKHPDYAIALCNLGALYYHKSDYTRAEKNFLESKSILEKTSCKEHPQYVGLLNNLFCLFLDKMEYTQALAFRKEANQQNTNLINIFFTFLSVQEREKYWNTLLPSFESSYSLSWFHSSPESNALNYDNALFANGLLLRTTNAVRDVIYSSKNQNLIARYEEFCDLRRQIGNLWQRGDGNEAYIKKLEEDAEDLDMFLTQKSAAFREDKADSNINWQDVQNSLQEQEAAVEFVSFRLYDKKWTSITQYAALVLRQGIDAPEWVPLPLCGEAVTEFLRMQGKNQEQEKVFFDRYGADIYAVVWQPLEAILEGATAVYYSPSGLLHKISFNAIPVKEGLPLMDVYDLNLVSSTRELVLRKRKTPQKPVSGVVYGGLLYTVDEEIMKQEAQKYDAPEAEEKPGLPDDMRKGGIRHWERLNYSGSEGEKIRKILCENNIPADLYQRAEGNKESFKNLNRKKKSVIHLATHGFFEKDYAERERLERLGGGKKVFENPLLRSGLVLAGANNAWKGKPVAGAENGILFADDVAKMNLLGAELVVLSACETGLGEVNNSEGVFGLQRAFKLAGAETLIMSLWNVNDKAASELMASFYEKWLSGASKQEAFKAAQRKLRVQYPSPFYWAAFVMID